MSDELKYDESEAVKFIRKLLPADKQDQYTDDEILYVIDIMYDWYEKNGYLSLDMNVTEEEDADIEKLTAYVKKEIARDGEVEMDPSDIDIIVKGELEYEESLEDFI
ncbi:MAG: hypothetical protein HDS42_01365 [Bacteroides sp.]|nr:hypothetical protein [Bacteroides sp.]MDE6257812.1 hypothetical protein [Muribaculaceae bacterium]